MGKSVKLDPHSSVMDKTTYGIFLRHNAVNHVFTNLVVSDKAKALELANTIQLVCGVTCEVVDDKFELCNA